MEDTSQRLEQLLRDAAEASGLPFSAPDEHGCAGFRIDGRTAVVVRANPDLPRIELYADPGLLPQEREAREAALEELLRANAFWQETGGATLSLRADRRTICLGAHLPIDSIHGATFVDWLLDFANLADFWRERLETGAFEASQAAERQDSLPRSDFYIRV